VRVLFDQGTPVPLRSHLPSHQVSTTYELGWSNLKNGELLQIAEQQSFDVLVTTDRNLKYQQNLSSRKIAIVVLSATSWPRIQKVLPTVVEAIGGSKKNGYVEVLVPYDNQTR
jgi:predicted nuclease of predicted toxin-antitoxin system